MSEAVRHARVAPNGDSLHAALAGPEHGPPVALLHDIPEP